MNAASAKISFEAARYIAYVLYETRGEPAILNRYPLLCPVYDTYTCDEKGRVVSSPHYVVGWFPMAEVASGDYQAIDVLGRKIFASRDTIRAIADAGELALEII